MKKSLLALAVLSAITGSAAAQTNVTVYGLVDVGIIHESKRPGGGGNSLELGSGIQSGSRLGFRGTEDLGGGLSAIFTIENGFQADTGTAGQGGLLWGRQAWVGLQGGFGAIKFGRQYTPVDVWLGQIDPFANLTVGKVSNLLVREYAARSDNAIVYNSPVIGGFSGDVIYGFGERVGDTSDNRFVGGSIGYSAGPLVTRLMYQKRSAAPGIPAAGGAAAVAPVPELEHVVLGAKYDLKFMAVSGLYAQTEQTSFAGATLVDANDASLGVSVPVGAGTVLASYTHRDDRTAADADVNMVALGYNHSLSKRTNLYATYSYLKNRRGTAYTVGGATEPGAGARAVAIGLRHLF